MIEKIEFMFISLFSIYMYIYMKTRYLYPPGLWILEYVLNGNKRTLSSLKFFHNLFWPSVSSRTISVLHLIGCSVYLCIASSSHCRPEDTADRSEGKGFRHHQ